MSVGKLKTVSDQTRRVWRAGPATLLLISAFALAAQISDEQYAVPSHPFTVALSTRSLQAAQADMAAFSEGSAGTLHVGTYQSVGARVLPRLLREFTDALPDVAVQLTESADDGNLLELVERGELDFTFVMLPVGDGPFETVELINRGTPTVPVTTGGNGGMNATFLAAEAQ